MTTPNLNKTAGDIMTAPPITIAADASLAEAARLMLDRRIGCLPVLDSDGKLAGMITEDSFFPRHRSVPYARERLAWILGAWIGDMEQIEETLARLGNSPVGEAMIDRRPIDVNDSLPDVARRLLEEETHHVAVVEDEKVVGVISRHDMAKLVIGL